MCLVLVTSRLCSLNDVFPVSGLSKEEINQENEEIQEQIKEYKRKVSMMRDLIEQMDMSYECSKRYIVVQRYRLMKTMIKTVIHNKWIL